VLLVHTNALLALARGCQVKPFGRWGSAVNYSSV
jgi:hypothetical protein